MKTDTYTKIVLTAIAVVLTLNLIKGSSTSAMADSKHYVTLPLNADGTINVTIKKTEAPMEVKISDVDAYAFRNVSPIRVKTD